MDKHVMAYLAGIVDADGSIGVKRSDYAMRVRHDAGQPIYSERITVRQVEPQAIDLLGSTFGGYRGISGPAALSGRPLFNWQVYSAAAGRALVALLPYLRIKRPQAENALALRALISQSRHARRWPVPLISDGQELITATEFASRLDIDRKTIYQAVQQGTVPSIKRDRRRWLPVNYLTEYAKRVGRKGGTAPRPAWLTEAMEQCYIEAKRLNHVGA